MKRLNWKQILSMVMLSVVLTVVTVQAARFIPRFFNEKEAKTDFGDFSGDSDYGGSWDSWDSGSSWDSDDSYGGGGIVLYSGDGSVFGTIFTFIFYMIIMMQVISWLNRRNQHGKPQTYTPAAPAMQPAGELQAALSDLKARDPGFSESRFLEDAANLYIRLQNAWTDRNLEPVRSRLSEEQYAAAERGVNQYLRAKQTNHVDRIAVLGTEIIGCTKDSRNDIITVRMNTRIVDYVTDDATGRVVRGDRNREKFMTYHWTMIRSLGKQTAVSGKITAKFCPHCGAPLNLNQSGVCSYCHSVVTSDDHDWVLTKIEGIMQRTM